MLEKFIKDYDKPEKAAVRVRSGRFAGFFGIICNVILFAVKVTLGVIFGSVSVIADSVNNLSDAGSCILTVVGYSVSGRAPDKEHPYGHARMEYLTGLFVAVIVTVLGVQMLTTSVSQIASGGGVEEYSPLAIVIIGLTILVKLFMAVVYYRIAKHIKSDALMASAFDSLSDSIATTAVIAGMLLTPVTGKYTDAVIGVIIALYIILMGLKLIKDASNTLLGVAPDTELVKKIIAKIRSYDEVLGIHDLVIHSYGAERCFASVHVEVDASRDIMKSHDCIDNIESDILRDMNIHLVIHLDPVCVNDENVNALRLLVSDVISEISAEFSIPVSFHDFRVVIGTTHSNLLFDLNVSSDMVLSDRELCALVSDRIREKDPKLNAVITVDRDYFSSRFGTEEDD